MDRKITVNINLDPEILQQLLDAVKSGKVKSRSEAVRYFINLGFQMEILKGFDRNDPEFLQKVKDLLQNLEKTNEENQPPDPVLVDLYTKFSRLNKRNRKEVLDSLESS